MDRRKFFRLIGAGVAGIALQQAIPLDRVWSFPKSIVVPRLSLEEIKARYLVPAMEELFYEVDAKLLREIPVGTTIRIRVPPRFIIRDYIGDFSQPTQWRMENY
jgi:hypothetical protein